MATRSGDVLRLLKRLVPRSNTQETTGYFDSPGNLRCSAIICRFRLLADAKPAEQSIEDVVVGHRSGDLA
jgi:hypothetical protein